MRWPLVVVLAACGGTPARAPAPLDVSELVVAPAHADLARHYAIWLGGAQVGTAEESEAWSAAGVIVRRREAMQFLRGDAAVSLETTIEITADPRLVASKVTWREAASGERRAQAVRDAAGWRVDDDAGVRRLPASAVPAELTPLLVRRDGAFAGLVFLPARGFALGEVRIEPVAPGRLVARGAGEATIDLGADALPARVVDGEGVIALRVSADEAARPFAPVDLIAATAIPLARPADPDAPHHLILDGELALPAVPGQAARRLADGVELALSPRLPGGLPPGPPGRDRTRDIVTLVADVHRRIAPDLAAHPTPARAARTATAGDCTTFALAYAALAGDRQIPTRVVTGFRVDGDRLIRHRWAVSWTGQAWIAVDAAFAAVPAGGDLVGLAVHDAGDVGLVAGEAALGRVRAARWR
ncbi:MAG TPA: transglutaminase domain-containing protein [Kofleriaceae bacterium]|nr:transglutaminase domain-containing protein [Kofleriaceae bacterium]